jgi:hypothetical protein
MNEEIKEKETQEGVSLEYTQEPQEIGAHKEEISKEEKREEFFSKKDIIKGFIFYELISRPISLRR